MPQRTEVMLFVLIDLCCLSFNKNSLNQDCAIIDRCAEEDASKGLDEQFAGVWKCGE